MIVYKSGYKYQLVKDYKVNINVYPVTTITLGYITLQPSGMSGMLTIKRGYAWDGPSGPTIDTANFMRGSLVHDVLYQLIRHGLLSKEKKDVADRELQRMCIEDGMSKIRAAWIYQGVKICGGSAIKASGRKLIRYAP